MSLHDHAYCSKCDVFDHEEGSTECSVYYASIEIPYQERMQKFVGKIVKLKDPTPCLYKHRETENGHYTERMEPPPGTFVRITHWTPHTPGMLAGDYWTIETLDGEFGATQIYNDELEELNALDKLSLIETEKEST